MADVIIPYRFAQRRGTAAQWALAVDPLLYEGEIGFELNGSNRTVAWKIGDGVTPWASLPYFASVSSVGLSLPAIFNIAGSPVTSTGVLTATFADQTAGKLLIAPAAATGAPTMRRLLAADLPNVPLDLIVSGATTSLALALGGTGATTAAGARANLGLSSVAYLANISPDVISGFQFRTTATQIIISRGFAITDTGAFPVYAGGTLSPGRAANTHYYIYVLDNGTVEVVATAPATPFFGSARGRSGISGRRYVGQVKTNASANYYLAQSDYGQNQSTLTYLHNVGANSRMLTVGTAATATNLSAAQWAPPNFTQSLRLRIQLANDAGTPPGSFMRYYAWDGSAFGVYSNLPFQSVAVTDVPCDTAPQIQYDCTQGATTIDLLGYSFAR